MVTTPSLADVARDVFTHALLAYAAGVLVTAVLMAVLVAWAVFREPDQWQQVQDALTQSGVTAGEAVVVVAVAWPLVLTDIILRPDRAHDRSPT